MKIYANSRQLTFKDIEGKDLWLKCYHDLDEYDVYVKVLKVFKNYGCPEQMKYIEVPAMYINEHNLEMLTLEEAIDELGHWHVDDLIHFKVCKPIDLLTTDEIYYELKQCPPTPF